jgi:hypothetical protein
MYCGRLAACVAPTLSGIDAPCEEVDVVAVGAEGATKCSSTGVRQPCAMHDASHPVPTQGIPRLLQISYFLPEGLSDNKWVTEDH